MKLFYFLLFLELPSYRAHCVQFAMQINSVPIHFVPRFYLVLSFRVLFFKKKSCNPIMVSFTSLLLGIFSLNFSTVTMKENNSSVSTVNLNRQYGDSLRYGSSWLTLGLLWWLRPTRWSSTTCRIIALRPSWSYPWFPCLSFFLYLSSENDFWVDYVSEQL